MNQALSPRDAARLERLRAGKPAPKKMAAPIIMTDGAIVDLAALEPHQVDFAHVANTLSKTVRFTGRHRGVGISVAQHCVMGADALFRESGDGMLAGYFLLHDAHEYVLGDIGRPAAVDIGLKTATYLIEQGVDPKIANSAVSIGIQRSKDGIDAPIIEAAQLPPISHMPLYHRLVAEMDERMCSAEAKALYGKSDIPLVRCDLPPPRLTQPIGPWGAMKAELAYIDRLERYLGIVVRPA